MLFKLRILYYYLKTLWLGRKFRNREALLRWQEKQVLRHLDWVLPRAPYYADRFQNLDVSQWTQIPLTDKKQMMDGFSRLNTVGITLSQALDVALRAETTRDFSPTVGNCTIGLSSGTSGHRGIFIADDRERAMHAGTMLARALPGPIWEKNRVAFFLRANSNLYSASRSSRLQFEFFDLIAPVSEHAKRLDDLNPTLIFAPPSVLLEIASLQESGAIQIRPKRIYSVAEVLDPLDQRRLERIFGQKIHQVYQCTEGFLGMTCEQGTLHLNETGVAFQMDWIDHASGKFYPILTDFRRTSQPMIRYRLNDILTLKKDPCSCGSPTLALEMIEGRSDDILEFPSVDDRSTVRVLPDFIRRCFLMVESGIDEYRVYQSAPHRLEIHFKGGANQVLAVQENVRVEIQRLADRMKFKCPELKFGADFPKPGLTKLRRIEKARNAAEL